MPAPKDIKVLNFNDKAFSVEDMSTEIQNIVWHYNSANKKDAELVDQIILIRTAKEGFLNQIRIQFETEQKAAAEKAAADAAKTAEATPAPAVDAPVAVVVPASN